MKRKQNIAWIKSYLTLHEMFVAFQTHLCSSESHLIPIIENCKIKCRTFSLKEVQLCLIIKTSQILLTPIPPLPHPAAIMQ